MLCFDNVTINGGLFNTLLWVYNCECTFKIKTTVLNKLSNNKYSTVNCMNFIDKNIDV